VQREDDKAETVRARLQQYEKMTAPLICFYRHQVRSHTHSFCFAYGQLQGHTHCPGFCRDVTV
jgi:adenylate kinase family enzyme